MANGDDLEDRVAWLEQAVEQLSRYSNPPVALPPKPGVDPAVLSAAARELVVAGNSAAAIQQQRLDTGSSLSEAKAVVDSFVG